MADKRKRTGSVTMARYERQSKPRNATRGVDHRFRIEVEREQDGRWLASVRDLPGVMAYGPTPGEASIEAEKIALRILLDRLEHQEHVPQLNRLFTMVT